MKLAFDNSWLEWTLLAALVLSSECGVGQTAVLLSSASVSSDMVHLSDLLSPGASAEVLRAGEQIELGRTPQCHTVRVFEAAGIESRTASWPALRGLTLSGPISVERTCFRIRHAAVQRVIAEFAQQKSVALMESPLPWTEVIYALRENPALEVEQALPDPARPGLQVRLRCRERAVCPSFWVSVPTAQPPHLARTATPALEPAATSTLVKVGQHVLLVLEDPPLRIQLRVTCLQSGALGKQIRAMDPSTHRVFQAEVTGAGTLTAHL